MWTERPKWTDGLILATAVGLGLSVIVSIGREPDQPQATAPTCQEVVVIVHQGEEILAQCPQGSWIDIVDNNVVCRCGPRREPLWFEHIQPVPPAPEQHRTDRPFKFDGKQGTPI
jgi:hypothetical protein